MIENVLLALVSALVYSVVFYVKKSQAKNPQEFNYYKFASTMVVGLGVGIMFAYSGTEITQQKVQSKLVLYTGTIALVESILKTLYRRIVQPRIE